MHIIKGKETREAIIVVILTSILILSSPWIVTAFSQGQAIVANPLTSPLEVQVNEETVLLEPNTPLKIYNKSTLCYTGEPYIYVSDRVRYSFKGWIIDGTISNDKCIDVDINDSNFIKPYFIEEVLIIALSEPEGIFSTSIWAKRGSLVSLTAPDTVEMDSVRYVFTMWSSGMDRFSTTQTIPAVKPTVITAIYDAMYLVKFNGIAKDTYVKKGEKLVLLAADFIVSSSTRQLYPIGFIIDGDVYELKGETISVIIDEPVSIKPIYKTRYKVTIIAPNGVEEKWIDEGEVFSLNAENIIQLGDDRRLVIDKILVNGIAYNPPKIEVVVNEPLQIELSYREQMRVFVSSILGREVHWVDTGSSFSLVHPVKLGGILISNVLDSYIVNGERVPHIGGTLVLNTVTEPLTITVVYKRQIEYVTLIGISMLISIILYYILTRVILS